MERKQARFRKTSFVKWRAVPFALWLDYTRRKDREGSNLAMRWSPQMKRSLKDFLGLQGLALTVWFFGLQFFVTTSAFSAEKASTNSVYLFTSFRGNGEDGLRFLYSFDAYHWTNVPGTFLKPNVGPSKLMRDPSLARGPDGTFHLVWTTGWHTDQGFGYANSKDLVHWSEQQFIPVMTNEPTTVNVWAPELFYDQS